MHFTGKHLITCHLVAIIYQLVTVSNAHMTNAFMVRFRKVVPTQNHSCMNQGEKGLPFPKCIHQAYTEGSEAFSYDEGSNKCCTFCEKFTNSDGISANGGIRYFNKVASTDRCPKDFHDCEMQCIFISTTSATWFDARDYCKAKGGHIVSIRNHDDEMAIKTALKNTCPFNTVYWIGGNDLEENKIWKWDYLDEHLNYTNWQRGQPNDYRRQDCMELSTYQEFQWNDAWCATKKKFICQIYH